MLIFILRIPKFMVMLQNSFIGEKVISGKYLGTDNLYLFLTGFEKRFRNILNTYLPSGILGKNRCIQPSCVCFNLIYLKFNRFLIIDLDYYFYLFRFWEG